MFTWNREASGDVYKMPANGETEKLLLASAGRDRTAAAAFRTEEEDG